MVADDASILGPGQCTVEAWLDHHRDDHQYWAVPHCRVGDWELQAGLGELRPAMPSGASPSGLIAGKTVFRQVTRNDWGIGLTLADQVGAGNGVAAVLSANMLLSFSLLDDRVRAHLNAGVIRERGGRHGATWATGAEWTPDRQLGLTFDVYGNGPAYLQAGVRYALQSGGVVLDAAVGDRLNLSGTDRYFSFGMTISLTPPR
jgi:hypothetical protein